MLTRLRVVRRGRGLVGGLRHRNLPVESLQVDKDLSERRVDTLQLRLQSIDRRLSLCGCVRGGVALVVGTSRHRLTHRREGRHRQSERADAQRATATMMQETGHETYAFVYFASENADAITASATAARTRIGVMIATSPIPIKFVHLKDGAIQPWTMK